MSTLGEFRQKCPGSREVLISLIVDPQVKLHKLGEDVHIAYGDRARGSGNDPRSLVYLQLSQI